MRFEITKNDTPSVATIYDWNTLGAVLGIKSNLMAWVLHERRSMQTRIRLGSRTVYKSGPYLRHVQNRIMRLLDNVYETIPGTNCAIAYRPGFSATEYMAAVPHSRVLMTFDIRKYYDHVTLQHIEDCLMQCGFQRLGARLVGRYCVADTIRGVTLQQGSPASPVLSNLVGHFVFDLPIREWLDREYPGLSLKYVRYCDNIAVMIHDTPPEDFKDRFKTFVKETLALSGFKTHKWNTIADNNPYKNQKFLGVVLNAQARAELDIVDRLRALMFNWCRFGTEKTIERFLSEGGTAVKFDALDIYATKLTRYLNGHINYIKRINEKQGLQLSKLYSAAVYLHKNNRTMAEDSAVFSAVKKYRDNTESIDTYMSRVEQVA